MPKRISNFKFLISNFQSNKGQSLIELVVMIGLALIVITGLTILTMNSIRNTQFSNAQIQASKFAQEGIERVRVIKTQNHVVCVDSSRRFWNDLWGYTCNSTNCKFILRQAPPNNTLCNGVAPSGYWLSLANAATSEDLGGGFFREVYIEDHGATNSRRKIVRSVVTWTDVTGTHQSELVTILTDY